MSRLTDAAASAVGSGRFVTPWSVAVSLPLSVTVMAPVGDEVEVLRALPASLATWICFAVGLAAVAVLERTLRSTRARTIAVTLGVLGCATIRPMVQDAWLQLGGLHTPAADQLPFRIATNIIVWGVVLSIVAVFEASLRSLRRTNTLLRTVIDALAQSQEHARMFAHDAAQLVEQAVSALHTAIAELSPNSAEVRRLGGEHFRLWSHRLATFAETGPETTAGESGAEVSDADESDADGLRTVPGSGARPALQHASLHRASPHRLSFRVPPAGVVTVLYAACLFPYAARTQEPVELLTGLTLLVIGGAIVDVLPRRRSIAQSPRGASTLFLILSSALGLALSLLAAAQGVAPLIAVVSAIAYLGLAVGAGGCSGALHSLRREQQRLSGAVATTQRATRSGTRPTREGLRGAAELLHRDGQGACIVFALAHPTPSATEIRGLQHDLAVVVDRLPSAFATSQDRSDQVSLSGLFETWAQVIDLSVDIDDDSHLALQTTPGVAQDCYDLIAEGLLNAVKHGRERRAAVSLHCVASGAGPLLQARVSSAGEVSPGVRLRASSRIHELGARLIAGHGLVVLEAVFQLATDPAVVSAEHRP